MPPEQPHPTSLTGLNFKDAEDICTRLVSMLAHVEAEPDSIGRLSTGEACAVALLLNRLDLLDPSYRHPLDALEALEQIGPQWPPIVRWLHTNGWRHFLSS